MPNHKKTAYQDTSLANLPGEKWKSLPVLEDYYMVSNYGRVKSLAREKYIVNSRTGQGHYRLTKEKIRKIKVHKQQNTSVGGVNYECRIGLTLSYGERTVLVNRLVYQAFIGDIDFESDQLLIIHKDGDARHNHYTNLVAKSRRQVLKRSYQLNRHISPFALKTKKELKEISRRSAISRQKKVIQYSLEGKLLRVFDSVVDAQRRAGIANLINTLSGRTLTAGGYIWRYSPGPKKIAVAHILKRRVERMAGQRKEVQQYTVRGRLVRTYKSIADAAARNHISASSISNCLAGRMNTAGGYRWKVKN